MNNQQTVRLACIGDIHTFWDDADTKYFNQSRYAGLLFTGDLPRFTDSVPVARQLSYLTKPAWFIPGNHDGPTPLQFVAELRGWDTICDWQGASMARRVDKIERALGAVQCGGYQLHQLAENLGLITARPHAMGPNRFYFRRYLRNKFGVEDYESSARLLKSLVDQAPSRVLFLAHNGPAGLGDQASDIWGCDFSAGHGDFGDPDLRSAIEHAKKSGREVLAVVAGHMHQQRKRGTGKRKAAVRDENVLYINAASVARHRSKGNRRHHVALEIGKKQTRAKECWVDANGELIDAIELGKP